MGERDVSYREIERTLAKPDITRPGGPGHPDSIIHIRDECKVTVNVVSKVVGSVAWMNGERPKPAPEVKFIPPVKREPTPRVWVKKLKKMERKLEVGKSKPKPVAPVSRTFSPAFDLAKYSAEQAAFWAARKKTE
jgi:hypothetical protein